MAEQVQISVSQIKAALEHDAEFFIQFFLEDELTFPVPDFHIEIFNLMVEKEVRRFACAIPRDHAKTTLAKLACVWYFLFSDYRFILYVSNTQTIAVPAANDIIAFMESENFRSVFGPLEWYIKQDGVGIYKFKLGDKVCILRALGAKQQVRGINVDNQRPELAVVDDLEDNDNIATQELFRKLKIWFYGPFRKCLDKFHNKIIQLGNMLSFQSLLYENCESDYWYSRRYGCILRDGTALWEDAWSREKLMQDFVEYQKAGMIDIWFAEMMNLPIAAGRGLIKPNDITYKPSVIPEDTEYGFITIDLAISDKTWAHKTVVIAHVWTGELWQIAESRGFKGIDPVSLFSEVMQLAQYWKIRVVGIENVAYQASLKFVFAHFCLERNIPVAFPVQVGNVANNGMHFVPLEATGRKLQRIAPWAGMLKDGSYALTEGDFAITEELLAYDPSKRYNQDDYIDCASYGSQMMARYMLEIQTVFIEESHGEAQTAYQVCEC